MLILISNDDGVYAPGIHALYNAVKDFTQPFVVAPDRDKSASSHSLTLLNPMRAKALENGFIMVDGTPADCVHLALRGLLPQKPKMVISGINAGANLGDDVLYSGTVAAAIEGRHLGFPAIAFSLAGEGHYYETAGIVAAKIVKQLLRYPPKNDLILNVNIPDVPIEDIAGFKVCRLGTRHPSDSLIQSVDPRNRVIYWIGEIGPECDAGPNTDFAAIKNNFVSITPLRIDLTRDEVLSDVTHWAKDLNTN